MEFSWKDQAGSYMITLGVIVATEVSSHTCIRKMANLEDTKC